MIKQITIENLKHIKKLTFDIPNPGVTLLAGANGAGKTSVLACLRRIGQSHAFANQFSSKQSTPHLDDFGDARITYTLGTDTVTYAYGGERWVPRPRSNNGLLDQFGYPSVLYIGATADRLTPRPEEFTLRRVRPEKASIREAANLILGTDKFDQLKKINILRGVGNSAYLLQISPAPQAKYISERNFSLGELCVLKLLRDLEECSANSLVLIDELELALHPKAQIELVKYLQKIAADKNLTVVFSTHSVTLLKRFNRKGILFLESNEGVVTPLKSCFPTYALGNIAYDEERAPDVILYVEDEAALYVSEALVRLCIGQRFAQAPLFPTVHVVPVGPFISVVRFLPRSGALLPVNTKSYALLDQDVETETLANWREHENFDLLAEFQRLDGKIKYLPWTPEVGLINFLSQNRILAQRQIREELNCPAYSLPQAILANIPNIAGGAQRDACKNIVKSICSEIGGLRPNNSDDTVRKTLFTIFARWYFENHRGAAMGLFSPLIT